MSKRSSSIPTRTRRPLRTSVSRKSFGRFNKRKGGNNKMGYPSQGTGGTGTGDATLANQTTLLSRLSAARAGYLDNLSGGPVALNGDMATVLSRLSAVRAEYLDALNRGRPNLLFTGGPPAIIALPAAAADLDFPSVVVAGLPAGLTIARA